MRSKVRAIESYDVLGCAWGRLENFSGACTHVHALEKNVKMALFTTGGPRRSIWREKMLEKFCS